MEAIRHALQHEVFQPCDERLLAFVHVSKAFKKKKTSFLCISVTKDTPLVVNINQIKKTDKNVMKKKRSWGLSSLTLVDGKAPSADTHEFDLYIDKVYHWYASNLQERQSFLTVLWKQCSNYSLKERPEFKNLPKEWISELSPTLSQTQAATLGEAVAGLGEGDDYQALTEREEKDLEQLISQSDSAISNAEAFMENLARDLSVLDGENVQSVLSSEKQVSQLMEQLEVAISEVERVEAQLNSYDNIMCHIRNTMEKMEEKNLLIKVANRNNQKLLTELERVIYQLELPKKHQDTLVNADLRTKEGLRDAIAAGKALQAVMNAEIHPALVRLAAVQEQKKRFDKWKSKFSNIISRHLNNFFIHLCMEVQGTVGERGTNHLTPSKYLSLHRELSAYSELMHWCKVMDRKAYTDLTEVYTTCVRKVYEGNIQQFLEDAKIQISGVTAALNREEKVRSSNWGLLGVERDQWGTEYDDTERLRFDHVLEKVLAQLEPVCLSEQNFCVTFFQLDVLSPTTKNTQTTLDGLAAESRSEPEPVVLPQKRIDKQVNEEVRRMMGDIFRCIETELLNFINYHERLDSMHEIRQRYYPTEPAVNRYNQSYCMYALVRFSQHVMSAQDTGSFLSMTFGSVLVQVKRNYDRYMQAQLKSIQDYKPYKKSRCGILPFVANFEEFARTAENIFKDTERRADLDKWYIKLVSSMFEIIPTIANDFSKTPEVVKMENFHHMFSLLSQLKISVLDTHKKEAKQKYNDALKAYVTRYFGRPLEKLNQFFDGVQAKVAQGVKESEISYQMAFSKQELRKVIREYPGREVKKGLDNLFRKVERHLCEEENLLQVVWRAMQEEFIQQYKYIEDLIQRCYPGSMITLDFAIHDILQFFSEIARSH